MKTHGNLDLMLANDGYDGRIETSLTHAGALSQYPVKAKQYERVGLGVWLVSAIMVEKFPSLVLGSPKNIEGAGCSIWYQDSAHNPQSLIAALVDCVFSPKRIFYLDPETGESIAPDFLAVRYRVTLNRSVRLRIPWDEIVVRAELSLNDSKLGHLE